MVLAKFDLSDFLVGKFWDSFIGGIFSLFWAAVFAFPVWLYIKYVPARRLWNTLEYNTRPWRKAASPLIILSATKSEPDRKGYTVSRTGLGQVQALSVIAPSLSHAYKDALSKGAVQMSTSIEANSPLLGTNDLILIGGPKTNPVAAEILARFDLGVVFETIASDSGRDGKVDAIRRTHDGEPIGEHLVTRDNRVYAFIAQFANPYDPSHKTTMTVLAGSSTYGTELAAQAIIDHKILKRFAPVFGKRSGFAAIVSGSLAGRSDSDRWVGYHQIDHMEKRHFVLKEKDRPRK